MLFDKFQIRMTSIACFFNVGNVCHGFGILTGEDIMFSVTIITISCPLHPLHDHLRMKTLLVFLACLLVASGTVHLLVRSLLPPLGMFVIFNMGVAIPTGEFSVDRFFKFLLRHKERNTFTLIILLF